MRRIDWQLRFSAFADERRRMPFVWGTNDCCTFAAAGVEALTGRNPMAAVEPYDSAQEALRQIQEGGGLKALATALLGAPVSPLMAAVGDVVLLVNEDRELLGICNGTNVLAPGAAGAAALDMNAALAAWKI